MPRLAFAFLTPPFSAARAGVAWLAGLASAAAVLGGCTTGTNTGLPEAGSDAAIEGDGGLPGDSGSHLPMGDGGPCVVATSVPGSQIPAYATVVPHLNACTATQISDFTTSCVGGSAMPGPCDAFQTSAANTGCMACLFPSADAGGTPNTGGVLLDYTGTLIVGVNAPGCIALADTTNGPACAAGLEPLFQCEKQACVSLDCQASPAATYSACLTSSETGACASQYAASSPCASEYADGGAGVGACASDTQVLNVICGTGM